MKADTNNRETAASKPDEPIHGLRELPDATLSSLVISLSAASLTYLGKAVAPGTDSPEPNLPLARHSISTLEMLRRKTAGNRTPEEDKLLEEMLYQLRLSYVKAEREMPARSPSAAGDRSEPQPDKQKPDGQEAAGTG